jgi:serine/threonine protein kinase
VQYLGKYEIIAEIGRGAMGAVYKARDPLIDRLVALKTITGGPSAQSNLLDRFYQEARSAGALQHPNIVTIYELGHEKNTPFIAMEYLEGESLDRIIEQHPVLPLSLKLGYIVRVCDALAYAHQHNVVHRDVKPANIMVTKEGVVKVVDFGIARLTDMSMTQPNMMIGSRAYMSPQLYKGERADARSDIWAVGVSLYELLAYKRPFSGDSEAELMYHIIYEKPEELLGLSPDCTEELAPIVNKMLEKKSEDRYQSMEDLLHAIEPIWKAAQQATVSGLLADCQQLLVAKDLQRAQALLRKALHIDVGNSQAKSMLEKVSVALRRTEILPRLEEHVSRAQGFLKAGQLREAKAEAQAALGLDSKHEPAHKLLAEVEIAVAKAQQLEQKLKLTKQRLAEGALTEAAAALGQALELDEANLQARELKKQIEEERVRREKRKKLGEILHRARTLWTELSYDECLTVLAAALLEFPNEPELRKLQDSARTDQAEQQKQRQMAEVRRLLGQQNFVEARKILDVLLKDYPQDTAVKNLQNLALQEEQEQKRQKRLESEITGLRGLLGAGKFKQVVAKGEPLLEEYPQEYELKELVNYARGEVAQQEQKRKEEEREKQIQGFLMCERYAEALDTARKAVEEFPKQDGFRKLAAEAEALKKEQEDRERARNEMQRRVREINSKIKQDKITDAIDLAQQTMETMGADPGVTQLLQGAEEKRKKKEDAERKVTALETLVNKGDHAGATQLFNEVMATQILQPSDPRLQELRGKISSLGSGRQTAGTQIYPPKTGVPRPSSPAKKEQPAVRKPVLPAGDMTQVSESAQNLPAAAFSATRVIGSGDRPAARQDGGVPRRADSGGKDPAARKTEVPGAPVIAAPGVRQAATPSAASAEPRQSGTGSMAAATAQPVSPPKPKPAVPDFLAQVLPILRRPPVLAGIGVVVVVVLAVMLWPHKTIGDPSRDLKLKQQAEELWQNRQFDQAEQVWQGLSKVKGPLENEAAQQVIQIEQKRADEQKKFDDGEALLKEKKDYAGAQQAFQDVIQLNLWHSEEAARELEVAKSGVSEPDVHKQEQDLFDQALKLFQGNDLEGARKGFRAMLDLNVAGSTLKPQAESYLSKIRQTGSDEKIYTSALQDFKDEKFAESRDALQELAKHKGPRSADAKKQLTAVENALNTVNTIEASIRSGAFRTAKGQLDSAASWNKTHEGLASELRRQEQQEFDGIKSNALALESKNDPPAIQRAIDELHGFEGRAEDPALLANCKEIEKRLNVAYTEVTEKSGDKAAFDAAVLRFNQAQQKKDADALSHLIPEFQKIANGNGNFKVAAAQYVSTAIPNAIQTIKQTAGKVVVQALTCGPGGKSGPEIPSANGAVTCAHLDASPALEWVGTPTVDFPDEAKQSGKLPYTLTVNVTVEASGKVKVEKDGNPDKAFFNKVKDASKSWKTTPPMSGGKPVSVRFPLTITFQK